MYMSVYTVYINHDGLLYRFAFAGYFHYKCSYTYLCMGTLCLDVKISLAGLCNWFLFLFCSQDSGDSSSQLVTKECV